jgi:hypothetical protein
MIVVPYIVSADLLKTIPLPGIEHHAHGIPADPTLVLLYVKWGGNSNDEAAFESLVGVRPFPERWEPMPADIALLLASIQDPTSLSAKSAGKIAAPSADVPVTPATPDTVAAALRKLPGPLGRMVR